MRVRALEFDSVRAFALSETYGDPSWGVVVKFRLVAPATSDQYLSEMLAAIPALRTDYLGHAEDSLGIAASHGPYRPGILTGANYAPCTVEEAEDKFGSWIRGLSEPDSIDTEPILSREIRPLLAQAELFAQSGVYNEWEQRNADPKVRSSKSSRSPKTRILSSALTR